MKENELMLMSILNCKRVDIYRDVVSLSEEQEDILTNMKDRRASGEPLQYIIGESEFYGLDLKIDNRVLVPRPETEILVDHVVNAARKLRNERNLRFLDLGTGSGNISVSIAKNIVNSKIVSVDISSQALDLALENAKRNFIVDKIDFINADMVDYLGRDNLGIFDFIISNPPYIRSRDIDLLPVDVRREPRVALDGREDGLFYIRHIIEKSYKLLKSNGMLIIEIGDGQAKQVKKIYDRNHGYKNIRFIKDYMKIDRIVVSQFLG